MKLNFKKFFDKISVNFYELFKFNGLHENKFDFSLNFPKSIKLSKSIKESFDQDLNKVSKDLNLVLNKD